MSAFIRFTSKIVLRENIESSAPCFLSKAPSERDGTTRLYLPKMRARIV